LESEEEIDESWGNMISKYLQDARGSMKHVILARLPNPHPIYLSAISQLNKRHLSSITEVLEQNHVQVLRRRDSQYKTLQELYQSVEKDRLAGQDYVRDLKNTINQLQSRVRLLEEEGAKLNKVVSDLSSEVENQNMENQNINAALEENKKELIERIQEYKVCILKVAFWI
jgi:chromosome segregation ATPase